MTLLNHFITAAEKHRCVVGIGLPDDLEQIRRIIRSSINVILHSKAVIIFVTTPEILQKLREITQQSLEILDYVAQPNPVKFLLGQLLRPTGFESYRGVQYPGLDAVIRGGLSASAFIKALRQIDNFIPKDLLPDNYPSLPYRLALLETAGGHQFFYAPIGIDEANTYRDKRELIELAIKFFTKMQFPPAIGILSGGRKSDIGRDAWVDTNIEEAENLVSKLQRDHPNIPINHFQILIENAIADDVNLLMAPEGIAGNLVYRTLIHLGSGKSYGALYLTQYLYLDKIIVDTSRVAPEFEIEGALYFAIGLDALRNKDRGVS
jgi:predicted methyltransferase MtxX (methanogen marker protein 4)